MFESGYRYTLLETIDEKSPHVCTYKYKFKTESKAVYHVLVERYEHSVYIIKFYPQRLEHYKTDYKYGTVLNNFTIKEVSKIIRTNVDIGIGILNKDGNASFGFTGVPKIYPEGHAKKTNLEIIQPDIRSTKEFFPTFSIPQNFSILTTMNTAPK